MKFWQKFRIILRKFMKFFKNNWELNYFDECVGKNMCKWKECRYKRIRVWERKKKGNRVKERERKEVRVRVKIFLNIILKNSKEIFWIIKFFLEYFETIFMKFLGSFKRILKTS